MALLQEEFTSLSDDVDLDRDRALVERCQAGDSGAFGNLYARYYERLLRFCQRRLNDRHEAEDAAQEAFARAWKALPNFAGERRFYPWLTVIAGNICTDMLRRRSRSTPTDDFELSSQQPIGGGGMESSDEFIIAAVDGELVNKALGRLSVRHRHVLAMREGSGWTYQQIADHEGVEIGTIETLLWRARQALKREFNVLSETKGALAGFLAGAGALVRRTLLRVASRTASLPQSGGGIRNAVAGVAVTSAAVAAAIMAPHAFSVPASSAQVAQSAPAGAAVASPFLPLTGGHSALGGSGSTKATAKSGAPTPAAASDATPTPLSGTLGPASGPLSPVVPAGANPGFSLFPSAPTPPSPSGNTAPTTAGSGLGSAASGLVGGLTNPAAGNGSAGLGNPITGLGNTITGLTGGSQGSGPSLPGLGTTSTSGSGDSGSSGSGGTSTGTTTPVTVPSLPIITGGLSTTVTTLGSLLGQG